MKAKGVRGPVRAPLLNLPDTAPDSPGFNTGAAPRGKVSGFFRKRYAKPMAISQTFLEWKRADQAHKAYNFMMFMSKCACQ